MNAKFLFTGGGGTSIRPAEPDLGDNVTISHGFGHVTPGGEFTQPGDVINHDNGEVYHLPHQSGNILGDITNSIRDYIDGITFDDPQPYRGGHAGSNPKPVYVDAPLATKYGMSAATAYAEEMANTAHQREMADLQKAGLNPVLAAGSGSGAEVVYGQAPSSGSGGHGHSSSLSSSGSVVGDLVTLFTGKSTMGKAAGRLVDTFINSGTAKNLLNAVSDFLDR